jgi:hypothetical protein
MELSQEDSMKFVMRTIGIAASLAVPGVCNRGKYIQGVNISPDTLLYTTVACHFSPESSLVRPEKFTGIGFSSIGQEMTVLLTF